MKPITRNAFLKSSLVAIGGAVFTPPTAFAKSDPPLDTVLVKEFVGKSHSDLDRVREMLGSEPTLLHATFDWGNGDFETAIGAASHVGYRELALFLLDNGARMNLFTAAMLGDLELVRLFIERYPGQLYTKGPHGLSLMHHARKGGEPALPVVEFLSSLGVKG